MPLDVRAFGSEARVRWIRSLPCSVCRATPSDNAHAIHTRGSRLGRPEHVIPLCRNCHREQETVGRATFAFVHRLDLAALAAAIDERWQRRKIGEPTQYDMDF